MLTFKEWTVFNRPKNMIGKKTNLTPKLSSVDAARVATRIDHSRFNKRLNTYLTSPDSETSGRFTDRTVQPNVPGTEKIKGVFAGSESDVAPYAIPRDKAWVRGDNKKIYVDKADLASIGRNRVTVNRFNSSNFENMPSGEQFSSNPGKPLSSTQEFGSNILKKHGYKLVGVNNFPGFVKRAIRMKRNFSGENIEKYFDGG